MPRHESRAAERRNPGASTSTTSSEPAAWRAGLFDYQRLDAYAVAKEALTDGDRLARRLLHIPRRIPDTTLRAVLMATDPQELRHSLYAQVRAAHRRKALAVMGLPFGQKGPGVDENPA